MAFIGPHYLQKFSGQTHQSTALLPKKKTSKFDSFADSGKIRRFDLLQMLDSFHLVHRHNYLKPQAVTPIFTV